MYGLNVDLLKANLGIPATVEHVKEIHEDFEDVMSGYNIPEATVEDESGSDVEAKVSDELPSLVKSPPCILDGAEEYEEEDEALEEGDSFSLNALLSVEERKIVALLERIESKFGTLQENENAEVRWSNFFILFLLEFLVCQEDLQLPRQVRLYPCQGGDHPWDVRAERALAQGQPWNSCH